MHPFYFNLHPAHLSLHPAVCNTLNVIWTVILYVLGNSPNLGPKIQSCLFWLKIGPQGNLEVLNPNPDLVFWNSNAKIHFWANLSQKSQSYQFCLKIGTHGIWRMLTLMPTLVFCVCNSKSIFWKIWAEKVKFIHFGWKLAHSISMMLILILSLVFWISYPKFIFGQI